MRMMRRVSDLPGVVGDRGSSVVTTDTDTDYCVSLQPGADPPFATLRRCSELETDSDAPLLPARFSYARGRLHLTQGDTDSLAQHVVEEAPRRAEERPPRTDRSNSTTVGPLPGVVARQICLARYNWQWADGPGLSPLHNEPSSTSGRRKVRLVDCSLATFSYDPDDTQGSGDTPAARPEHFSVDVSTSGLGSKGRVVVGTGASCLAAKVSAPDNANLLQVWAKPLDLTAEGAGALRDLFFRRSLRDDVLGSAAAGPGEDRPLDVDVAYQAIFLLNADASNAHQVVLSLAVMEKVFETSCTAGLTGKIRVADLWARGGREREKGGGEFFEQRKRQKLSEEMSVGRIDVRAEDWIVTVPSRDSHFFVVEAECRAGEGTVVDEFSQAPVFG